MAKPIIGHDADACSPERITLTLTAGQVDYLRELVFEDLKNWAEAVRDQAWSASETQGRSTDAADAEEMCRSARDAGSGRPHMAVLDLLGWEHPNHLAYRLQKQRERDGES